MRRLRPQPTWSQYKDRYLVDGRPDDVIPYYRRVEGLPYTLAPHFKAGEVLDTLFPGSRMDLSLNEEGFRTHPFPLSRTAPDETRVLLLGDSATFGFGSMEKDTFPRRLEGLMRKQWGLKAAKVYNLGVPGYGVSEYHLLLRRHLDQVRPRLVIVNVQMSNDRQDLETARLRFDADGRLLSVARPQYRITKDGRLRDISNPLYRVPWLRDSHLALYLYRRSGLEIRVKAWRGLGPRPQMEMERDWSHLLAGTQGLLDRKGIPVLWVLLPSEWQVPGRTGSFDPYFAGIPLRRPPLDLAPVLGEGVKKRGVPVKALFVDGSHFTALGHEFVARLIFEEMSRRGLKPALMARR